MEQFQSEWFCLILTIHELDILKIIAIHQSLSEIMKFTEKWQEVEKLTSPDSNEREAALDSLMEQGVARTSPLIAYILATRISDPDLELRAHIAKALGSILTADENGQFVADQVMTHLHGFLYHIEKDQILKLLEVGEQYLSAGEKFTEALELKPDYLDALIQQALLYEKEALLEQTEGNLEEASQKIARAIKEMEDIYQFYPFQVEVVFQLGRFYFNNNQTDEAIKLFQEVISVLPNYSNAHYSLAVAYQKKGKNDLAIEEFEKVLQLNPGNQDVQEKLEKLKEAE